MKNTPLSVVINLHPRDDKTYLVRCLKSVKNFAHDIVLVNMTGEDQTSLVKAFPAVRVFPYKALNYVEPARNFGISKARYEWVMLLDPDEYLTKTLKAELKKITHFTDVDYVRIPRKNIIFGKWLRYSRWWPDYLIRFFKKGSITWPKEIHAQPELTDRSFTLLECDKLAIRHQHYRNLREFILRSLRYSQVQAQELIKSGYHFKLTDLIVKPTQDFLSRFFASQGYRDGLHGLILAVLQAFATALVYLTVWEKEGQLDKPLAKDSFVSALTQARKEFSFWFFKYLKTEVYPRNLFLQLSLKVQIYLAHLGLKK